MRAKQPTGHEKCMADNYSRRAEIASLEFTLAWIVSGARQTQGLLKVLPWIVEGTTEHLLKDIPCSERVRCAELTKASVRRVWSLARYLDGNDNLGHEKPPS